MVPIPHDVVLSVRVDIEHDRAIVAVELDPNLLRGHPPPGLGPGGQRMAR
jgi:hypothetical protein